ncbi:MAG: pentapeptide repeat-containing protein [Gammaproteobacteria bacterium]
MNFYTLVLSILLTVSSYATASTYIPTQLEQFKKTEVCIGCDLSEADICFEHHNNANLSNALLVRTSLAGAAFNVSNFSRAEMMYANLSDLQASASNFTSANLTGSNLTRANLSSADFKGANLVGVNFTDANLARATISLEQLAKAKTLSCAIMPDGTRHASDKQIGC